MPVAKKYESQTYARGTSLDILWKRRSPRVGGPPIPPFLYVQRGGSKHWTIHSLTKCERLHGRRVARSARLHISYLSLNKFAFGRNDWSDVPAHLTFCPLSVSDLE